MGRLLPVGEGQDAGPVQVARSPWHGQGEGPREKAGTEDRVPLLRPPPRYNEIAELVVAAAQRRLVQQRAEQEGVVLPAGRGAVVKVRLLPVRSVVAAACSI